MRDGVIEQAIYGAREAGGPGFLARSPGFLDDWLPVAERLVTNFGERPAGVACPGCVFAQPFDDRRVAVVQAADQGGALTFRLLIVPADLYRDLGGDPFYLSDQFPPPWEAGAEGPVGRPGARASAVVEAAAVVGVAAGPVAAVPAGLPSLRWTAGPPPARTVEQVQKVLNGPHCATLLGGVQALLDGRRLVFERPAPDPRLIRGLWALLPTGRRSGLWPATFAFGDACRFDAFVVPRAASPDFDGCLTEEQASDYPEGAYEMRLQTAVEAGDQRRMDDLFAGRTPGRWIRIAFLLCALAIVNAPFVMMMLAPTPPPAPAPIAQQPTLPAAAACPPLNDGERQELAARLQQFARRRGIDLPAGTTDEALTDGIERIDRSLAGGEPGRDPGRLRDLGPVQRQLRALLWKHGVADYDAPGLNPAEMVEKLQDKVGPK